MSLATAPTTLAQRHGQTLSLTVVSGGAHVVAGTVSGQTTTVMSVRAVVMGADAKAFDGSAILEGDFSMMIPVQASLTVEPIAGQTFATIDGVVAVCKAVKKRRALGSVVSYLLLMRAGG